MAVSDVLEVLRRELELSLNEELIGGASVGKTMWAVDLKVAFTPVVLEPFFSDYPLFADPPKPTHLQKIDGAYCIPLERRLDESEVRAGRCRYLLLRDFYVRQLALDLLSHPVKQKVLAYYFPEGLFLPQIVIDQFKKEAKA